MSSGPPSKKAKTASSNPAMATALQTMARCFKIDFDAPSFIGLGPKIFDITQEEVDLASRPQSDITTEEVSTDDSSSNTFSTNVSVSASYGCFGGSASFGLDKSDARSKHTTRITIENWSKKYHVSGTTKFILQPENFLDEDLAEKIREADITLEDLEKVIGVFYARELSLGGNFSRSYLMEKTAKETSSDVQAKVEATFGGVLASASLSVEVAKSKTNSKKKATCRIVEEIVGGDTSIWLGSSNHRNGDKILGQWAKSVTDSKLHPVSYELEFSWKLVEALNQSLGEDYKAYLKAKWDKQQITVSELEFVQEDKPPPYFYLKNGNGHYLAVPDNNPSKPLCVWSKESENGQLWIWEDVKQDGFGKIKSKLGDKYVSVSQNSGSRGAEVLVWGSNPAEEERGQRWKLTNGYLKNDKSGHSLAVNGNGGRGSKLCQWSSKDEGGQRWEQIDHVE